MKSKFLYLLAFLAFGVIFSACKEKVDPQPTPEEEQLAKLAKTWVVANPPPSNAVTVGSSTSTNDVTTDWAAFTITFTDGNYTSSGASSTDVWPTSGTWEFATDDVGTLIRSDGVEVVINVTETTLKMNFDYDSTGGRLDGTDGSWEFNLVAQ